MPKETGERDTLALITDLAISKVEYAKAFLTARVNGSEIGGGRATVEDAKQWATRSLESRGIEDAEVLRWRLMVRLGVPRMTD